MIVCSQFYAVSKDLTVLVHSFACIGFFILVSGMDLLGGRLSCRNRLRPFSSYQCLRGFFGRTYLDFCLQNVLLYYHIYLYIHNNAYLVVVYSVGLFKLIPEASLCL